MYIPQRKYLNLFAKKDNLFCNEFVRDQLWLLSPVSCAERVAERSRLSLACNLCHHLKRLHQDWLLHSSSEWKASVKAIHYAEITEQTWDPVFTVEFNHTDTVHFRPGFTRQMFLKVQSDADSLWTNKVEQRGCSAPSIRVPYIKISSADSSDNFPSLKFSPEDSLLPQPPSCQRAQYS